MPRERSALIARDAYRPAAHLDLDLDVRHAGRGHVTLQVGGELDLATAGHLEDAVAVLVAEHGGADVDLSGVTFTDVTGLRAVLRLAATAGRTDVTLVASAPAIDRLVDLLADAVPSP